MHNNNNYNSNRYNHCQAEKQTFKLQILQILIKLQQLQRQQNYFY